jgi:ectoine hydroxylase
MVFLDDVNEFNGPLFFIPASHHIGCIDAPKAEEAPEGWEGNVSASLTYQVDEKTVTALANKTGLFSAVGKKGTAVWFHGNLIHASPPNISPFERRIIILTYNAVNNAPASTAENQRPDFLNARDREALQLI